jgi:hypothetical protein
MTNLSLVLAILIVGGGAATSAAHETRQEPRETARPTRTQEGSEDAGAFPASLRLSLAFWLPIYYGIFVWLLSPNGPGGGSRRKVEDRDRGRAPLPALSLGRLVPARAASRRGPPLPRSHASGRSG